MGGHSYAKRFSFTLSLSLVVLLAVQAVSYTLQKSAERASDSRVALAAAGEQIRYYDELLTMSARLAVASGDRSYLDRYHQAVPKLDRVLADAVTKAHDPAVTAVLEQVSQANQALIDLEERSFTQLAAGDRAGAYATVSSPAYTRQKVRYAQSLETFLARLAHASAQHDAQTERDQTLVLALSALLGALILTLWIATALGLRRTSRERDQVEQQLERQALHDPLTGLPNRLLLSHHIERASRRRDHGLIALLYVDLDDFKVVNDVHGHQAGDRVLVEVARRLQACVRPGDVVARLGGDEFAVLVEDLTDGDDVRAAGERVGSALSPPIDVEGAQVWCRASVGSAVVGESLIESAPLSEDLLLKADLAMYLAKSAGKGRVVGFERHMYDDVIREARLKAEIRQAFERREFAVWFQPVVDLRRGSMTGVEALVRWIHPERGLVGPDAFLPHVAAMGFLPPLTRQVLQEACDWAQHRRVRFPDEVPLTVAVNVSPHELTTAEIIEEISRSLSQAGLPASSLSIEVTETATFDDLERMRPTLTELRSMGVAVAVDDFGTGQSSLTHLREFPVDLVKIDQSFVGGLATSLEDSMVVAAVVRLAHTMSLSVVAEGVEQVKQLLALRELECEFAQGYLLARPTPGDEVPEPGEIEERLARLGFPSLRPASRGEKITVLIADDAEEERRLLRRMLERTGKFRVVAEAANGIEAVAYAASHSPQVVMLDLEMPRLDGMSALPLIATASPNARIVVLSGHATDTLLSQAIRIGAAACLEKGVGDIPLSLLEILKGAP